MSAFAVLANAYRYPAPGRLGELETLAETLPSGGVQAGLQRFLEAVRGLSLADWEELHTRTLDLSPLCAPYVGHSVYGESYQRGQLMARLRQAQRECGVDEEGELPDHLLAVLRYLDVAPTPLAELENVLPRAVERMARNLRSAEADNPYLHLLRATLEAARTLGARAGGDR